MRDLGDGVLEVVGRKEAYRKLGRRTKKVRVTRTEVMKRDERRVDLTLWWMNGALYVVRGRGRRGTLPQVEVGRTDSKTGMGFIVDTGREPAWNKSKGKYVTFVLDRNQVVDLRDYLGSQLRRLRKSKKKAER